MDEITKMLRAVINGQSALREEFLGEINKLRKEMSLQFDEVRSNAIEMEKRLTSRIDKIGKAVAYLEDDTPTRQEYNVLGRRVTKIEKKLAS